MTSGRKLIDNRCSGPEARTAFRGQPAAIFRQDEF